MSTTGLAPTYDIDAPESGVLVAVHAYWDSLRRDRRMPARSDVDPTEIVACLPHIIMYEQAADGDYRIRLVGTAIVEFLGMDTTGKSLGDTLPPDAAEALRDILRSVSETGRPRFRAGTAYWWVEKNYRSYEAAFLPLSPDDRTVDVILGGIVFNMSSGDPG